MAKLNICYTVPDFANIMSSDTEVAYHQTDTNPAPGTVQKRLVEHTRNIFYKNDLSGALSLNQLESKGILFEYMLPLKETVLIMIQCKPKTK